MIQNMLAYRQESSQCKTGQVEHTSDRGYKASSSSERQQGMGKQGRVAKKGKGGQRGKAGKVGVVGETWEGSRDNWQNEADGISQGCSAREGREDACMENLLSAGPGVG